MAACAVVERQCKQRGVCDLGNCWVIAVDAMGGGDERVVADGGR
jgi:hypothetical protein